MIAVVFYLITIAKNNIIQKEKIKYFKGRKKSHNLLTFNNVTRCFVKKMST